MIIKAKNFEIIDDLELELKDGITVIVGASNNGKSSIIRLLRAILYNLNGDASIQQGQDAYTLGIIDNGSKVIVKRDMTASNKTVYSVNGTILKKVGRNIVPEVEDALNIKVVDINKKKVELNFLKQIEYPFLIGETGSFIYDFLSSSSNQTDFSELLKLMKTDQKEISDNKRNLEGQTDVLKDMFQTSKDTYEKLQDVNTVTDMIFDFDTKIQYLQKLEDTIKSLEYADANIFNLNNKMDYLLERIKVLSDLDSVISNYNDNLEMLNFCDYIKSIEDKILSQSITLRMLDDLNMELDLTSLIELQDICNSKAQDLIDFQGLLDNINNILELTDSLKNVNKSNEKVLNAINEVLFLKDQSTEIQAECNTLSNNINKVQDLVHYLTQETFNNNVTVDSLVNVKSELNTFDVCPICNSKLKED